MKIYKCGDVEIKNVELFKRELEALGDEFKFVGFQRSLSNYNRKSYEDVEFIILDGFKEVSTDNGVTTTVIEDCKFLLPLFDKDGYSNLDAMILGVGREINKNNGEPVKKEFEITQVIFKQK